MAINSKKYALLGVPVENVTMQEAIEKIAELIEFGGFHQVATANLDFLVKARKDRQLMHILRQCSMVLADGMPLVWASKLIGQPLKERVAGSDMMSPLGALAKERGYRIFLLGASEENSKGAEDWFERNYPGTIAGRYSPPLAPLDKMDNEAILRRIADADPDIILVAFGNPKQEKWITLHQHLIQRGVAIGVGASLDFLAGYVSRAPLWVQKIGAEWIYRLVQEPKRLASRYADNLISAFAYFPKLIFALRAQKHTSSKSYLDQSTQDGALVLRPVGQFTDAMVDQFEEVAGQAIKGRLNLLVDLSATDACGIDALGALIVTASKLDGMGKRVQLKGMSDNILRVLETNQLANLVGQEGAEAA